MIGYPALREVIGSNTFRTIAPSDQGFARRRLLGLLLANLFVLDPRCQHRQRLRLVLVLGSVVLTFDDDTRRQMRNAHGGIGLVDVLAACTGGAEGIDAQLRRIEHDVFDRVGFRHHGHGAGAGVNAALCLGRRNALHAMAARLELQFRVDAQPDDLGNYFLVSPSSLWL